jgi:predicted nucleic acid-binding protein
METMAAEPAFVDTNILVYANTATASLHTEAQSALKGLVEAGAELWISRQVLYEYLATLSRPQPFSNPVAPITLVADVSRFLTEFRLGEDGPSVTSNLLALIATIPVGGKQIHDANIVATMQAYGIRRLLTHNASDFVRFVPAIEIISILPAGQV